MSDHFIPLIEVKLGSANKPKFSLEVDAAHGTYGNTGHDYVTFSDAVWAVAVRAIPSSITMYVEFFAVFANILVLSQLGDPLIVSSCGLGTLLLNLTVNSIDMGL